MHEDPLEQAFPELHALLHDPLTRRVVEDLNHVYVIDPPSATSASMYVALQEHVALLESRGVVHGNTVTGIGIRPRRFRRPWHYPHPIKALLFVLILALCGVPVARQTIWQDRSGALSGTWPDLIAHAGILGGVSADMCGFTVAVAGEYADANDVVVEYRVQPPIELTVQSLQVQSGLTGSYAGPTGYFRPISTLALPVAANGSRVFYQSFDASGLPHSTEQLDGYFVVKNITAVVQRAKGQPTTTVCIMDGDVGTRPESLPSLNYVKNLHHDQEWSLLVRSPSLNGPAHFGIPSAPYQPRSRVIRLDKLFPSGSSLLELQKLVITPSETRLYVRGGVKCQMGPITLGGQRISATTQGSTGNGVTAYSYETNLSKAHGDGTITLPAPCTTGKALIVPFTVPG